MPDLFDPQAVYVGSDAQASIPRVFIAPPKYIQVPGALEHIGRYFQLVPQRRIAILASSRGHSAEAGRVQVALQSSQRETEIAEFSGECSLPEIERHTAQLTLTDVELLIAVGGGKCVDAGKCIAHRLDVPLVVIPTLASNDAPCSALSVLYTPEGVMNGAEFFPQNPLMVIVDTQVVADAAERFLVAGMGDAMATWYEARVCQRNPHARTVLGTRPTLAATALSQTCAHHLFESGTAACTAVRSDRVTEELEQVVEANTLLSGVGFESGGLAGAHAYAQGYTFVPSIEHSFLHGEMVGMGVIAQLMLEDDPAEARKVAEFFAQIGLPIHLQQIGTTASSHADLDKIVQGAMSFAPLGNFPFEVTPQKLKAALLAGDELGRDVAGEKGDAAYRQLQA